MESSNFSSSDSNADGNTSMNGNTTSGSSTGPMNETADQSAGLANKARGAFGSASEKLGDVGSSVRERAGSAKDSLANALESGAEKLRARGSVDAMAAVGSTGGPVAIADDKMGQMTTTVAGGMEAASEWLRDADLNSLKASVETQVKEHPGRTLLIAVGVGYLLGKALRK